jgi:hypothetical protein
MGSLAKSSGLLLPRFGRGTQEDRLRTLEDAVYHLVRDDAQPTRWNDLITGIGVVSFGGASDPTPVAYQSGYALNFQNARSDVVYFNVQLSHMVDTTLPLEFHVHCGVSDNNTGNVRWELTYNWAGISAAWGSATTPTAVDVPVAANSSGYHLVHEVVASISPPAGNTVSAMLLCNLKRLGSADSYNGDVYVVSFDFHEPRNTNRGSQLERAKWDR